MTNYDERELLEDQFFHSQSYHHYSELSFPNVSRDQSSLQGEVTFRTQGESVLAG
jgi:hypothetical protein